MFAYGVAVKHTLMPFSSGFVNNLFEEICILTSITVSTAL